jgi:hypothetical protein
MYKRLKATAAVAALTATALSNATLVAIASKPEV